MDGMTRRDAVKATAAIAGLGVVAATSALAQEPAKTATRVETDSLGPVNVADDKLWARRRSARWSISASATTSFRGR